MGEGGRERRYPPTPYPPGSEATQAYRDGWDLGWKFAGQKGRDEALRHYRHMGGYRDGDPHQHGYRDGARARLEFEAKARAVDPDVVRRDRELEARWRREWGTVEPPY